MKNSSTDPAGAPEAQVRAARFDRPLTSGMKGLGSAWGDPEIDRVLAAAVERAREQARSSGYALGWAQGRQAAAEAERVEAERRAAAQAQRDRADRARLDAVLQALDGVAAQAQAAAAPALADLADTLADGALELARAVLGRELATVDAVLAEAVRIALRTLGDATDLTLYLNPADHTLLTSIPLADTPAPDEPWLPEHVRLVPDPAVPAGTVRAQTPTQRLLVDLPAALDRAGEVLRG